MIGSIDTVNALATLGLDVTSVSEAEPLERPSKDASQGFLATEAVPLRALEPSRSVLIPSATADAAGFDLRRYDQGGDVWELYHESGELPSILPARSEEVAIYGEDGFLRLDLSRIDDDILVCFLPGETTLLSFVRGEDRAFSLQNITLAPVLSIPSPLSPPVREWLEQSSDQELVEELAELVELGGEFGALVAAGALARFARMSGEAKQEAFANLIKGGQVSRKPPLRWSDALDEKSLARLEQLALTRAELLEEQLERLASSEPPTSEELCACCIDRDDVESLRVLLIANRRHESLDALLSRCDELGSRFIERERESMLDFLATPRLERALLERPGAWWIALAILD